MNSKIEEQIQHVEMSLEEAKRIADFGDALDRLSRSPDFKTVILEGYFKEEAARLVMLTADTTRSPVEQDNVLHSIRGVAELRGFFIAKKAFGDQARKEVLDFTTDLGELRAEEGGQAEEVITE